jgi:hypothetical protein
MNSNILEIRSFCLRPDADERALINAAHDTMALLRRQRGFMARSIARGENGSWTEIVHWLDRASAIAAGEQLKHVAATRAYADLIDPPTVKSAFYPLAHFG